MRWKNGFGYDKQLFAYAIKKYGWDNFKHEILLNNLTKTEAQRYEVEYIQKYDSLIGHKGYNVSKGGQLICKNSSPIIVVETGVGYANADIATLCEDTTRNHMSYMLHNDFSKCLSDKWDKHYTYLQNLWKYSKYMYGYKSNSSSKPVVYLKTNQLFVSSKVGNNLLNPNHMFSKMKNVLSLENYIDNVDAGKLKLDMYMDARDYFKIYENSEPFMLNIK